MAHSSIKNSLFLHGNDHPPSLETQGSSVSTALGFQRPRSKGPPGSDCQPSRDTCHKGTSRLLPFRPWESPGPRAARRDGCGQRAVVGEGRPAGMSPRPRSGARSPAPCPLQKLQSLLAAASPTAYLPDFGPGRPYLQTRLVRAAISPAAPYSSVCTKLAEAAPQMPAL